MRFFSRRKYTALSSNHPYQWTQKHVCLRMRVDGALLRSKTATLTAVAERASFPGADRCAKSFLRTCCCAFAVYGRLNYILIVIKCFYHKTRVGQAVVLASGALQTTPTVQHEGMKATWILHIGGSHCCTFSNFSSCVRHQVTPYVVVGGTTYHGPAGQTFRFWLESH